MGGYGVLHACRRMEKEEKTAASGEYILLNVYSDDHVRNIDRWWSWLGTRESVRNRIRNGLSSPEVWMFHGVPWPYLRLTKDTGTFQEFENEYSTPESLYLLYDPDHVYESFKDEFTVQVHLAEQHAEDVKTEVLQDCRIRCKRATDSGFMKPAFRKQKTTPAGIKSHFGLLPGRDVGRSSTTLSQSLAGRKVSQNAGRFLTHPGSAEGV